MKDAERAAFIFLFMKTEAEDWLNLNLFSSKDGLHANILNMILRLELLHVKSILEECQRYVKSLAAQIVMTELEKI